MKPERTLHLLSKCEKTFESLHHVFQMLKRSAPEDLPKLIAEVDIDFLLMQAEIKDHVATELPIEETKEK